MTLNPLITSLRPGSQYTLNTIEGTQLPVTVNPSGAASVAFSSPVASGNVLPVGLGYRVAGTFAGFNAPAVSVQLGTTNLAVPAVVSGNTWSAVITPAAGDAGPQTLSVSCFEGNLQASAALTVEVLANAAFWVDASDPASYTSNGELLTSLRSLISRTSLSTIVGSPKITRDPRNGQSAFQFTSTAYVTGSDATALAAVTGLDKPFTIYIVATVDVANTTGNFLAFGDGVNAGNAFELGQSVVGNVPVPFIEKLGNPAGPVRDFFFQTFGLGTHVYRFRSADGLTVGCSIDGGPETTVTLASPGAIAPTNITVGALLRNAVTFPFNGFIYEIQQYGAALSPAAADRVSAGLLAKWVRPPTVYFIGDSITTAELATNAGFRGLLQNYCAARGVNQSQQGPLAGGGIYPIRHCAQSGDQIPTMLARVNNSLTGLGVATAFAGVSLALIFAGTNSSGSVGATIADYTTLLNAVWTKGIASNPAFRIAVTTITPIVGSTYPQDFNAALPAVWQTFDPDGSRLLRWNAFGCFGSAANAQANGWLVDTTHPSNAGYVQLATDPTNGLIQAVFPFLDSLS